MSKEIPGLTPLMSRRRFLHIASLGTLALLGTVAMAKQSKLHQTKSRQALQLPANASPITLNGWMLRESDF